jgi:predicted DNA-binding transcriptional regulator AlpA
MIYFSTDEAARRLGIGTASLHRYVALRKVPAPKATRLGKRDMRAWTEKDVERVRETLPKIANGRKTRYQKLQKKKNKAQARVPVTHKTKKKK